MVRYLKFLIPVLLLATVTAMAAPPRSLIAHYNAGFGKFKAQSVRSLDYAADSQQFEMRAETSLTLLGASLSSIEEVSTVQWLNDKPLPSQYSYVQKGLGSRQRSVVFDQQGSTLQWTVDEKQGELAFSEPVYDDLSVFLAMRDQLMAGRTSLEFTVMDKSEIKPYRYEVAGTESLFTPIGEYEAVHIIRIREPDSTRKTEFWLAPELDYVLIKLQQTEPDGSDIKLDLREIIWK